MTSAIALLVAMPLGLSAAVYLSEYASPRARGTLKPILEILAGVPTVVYGYFALTFMTPLLRAIFGANTVNIYNTASAGLVMGIMILPLISSMSEDALSAVPRSLREAAYGLGATQWQTVWSHVLPNAMPGILTGAILAISRAVGETAPLIVIGASTFTTLDPQGPFSKFTALPIQIYNWTTRAQGEFHHLAAAAIVVLLVLLLSLNASAIFLRNRFSRRLN